MEIVWAWKQNPYPKETTKLYETEKNFKKGKGINLIKIMNSITHFILSRSDIHLTQSNIVYKEKLLRHQNSWSDFPTLWVCKIGIFF